MGKRASTPASVWLLIAVSGAAPLACADEQERDRQDDVELRSGWMGVVRFDTQTGSETAIEIEFPRDAVGGTGRNPDAPVQLSHDLVLFDDQGELGRLPRSVARAEDWKFASWCVNDGGYHYRPSLRLAHDEVTLNRRMVPRAEADQIAAFVYHGPSTERLPRLEGPPLYDSWSLTPETGLFVSKAVEAAVRLQGFVGRGEGEPRIVARVIEHALRDNGCGRGLAEDSLELETARGRVDLRCCGP